MANKFRRLTHNIWVRPTGEPGQVEGEYREDISAGLKAKEELRKVSGGEGLVQQETGLRMTASYPKSVEMEMHADEPETARNPEARMEWLRDNAPEHLLAHPSRIPGLGPKRSYHFFGRKGKS